MWCRGEVAAGVVAFVVVAGLLQSGCVTRDACLTEAEPAMGLKVRTVEGERVLPDEIRVTHDGTTETAPRSCGGPTVVGVDGARSGEFEVAVTCGNQTRVKTVDVSRGECSVETEQVEFEFDNPDCEPCGT